MKCSTTGHIRDVCRNFSQGGGGGGINYRSLLWFNTTLYLVCRGPKSNWSSVSPDPVPCAPQNWPKSQGFFFHQEGREQSRKALQIPHRILSTILKTNPMSVRGEPAATRFIVCHFTLPSSWPWVIGGWMIAKAHWGEQQLEFFVVFLVLELLARAK